VRCRIFDKLDKAQDMADMALTTMRTLHGENSDYTCGALSVQARIASHRGDTTTALSPSTHALDLPAPMEVPSPRMEILNRQASAMALAALGRQQAALDDIAAAIAPIKTAAPAAHAKRAGLLAFQARLQRSLGDAAAANASIEEARALAVPARYLAPEDASAAHRAERADAPGEIFAGLANQ
jgi:hypothetical protein